MAKKPDKVILEQGIEFAQNNIANAKEGEEETRKEGINFDYNALKNIKR